MELVVAFGTDDGHHLKADDHVGMSPYFAVYKVRDDGHEFIEQRENSKYAGDTEAAHGDVKKAQATLGAMEGIDVLAGRRFGPNLPRLLKKVMCVVVRADTIEEAIHVMRADLDGVAAECNKGEQRKHLVLQP